MRDQRTPGHAPDDLVNLKEARLGLVHRLGQYVFATRAAHTAHRLAG
jgi:hypothetical protein